MRVDALDNSGQFPVSWLHRFGLSTSFCACHNCCGGNLAHQKHGLVEVVDVGLHDTVLCNCILHKHIPATNNSWIFAFGSLVVVFPIKACLQLWMASNKAWSPTRPNVLRIALSE